VTRLQQKIDAILSRTPQQLILILARLALAVIFWQSGQTKVDGLSIDLINFTAHFGLPTIKESTYYLFEYEYALPLIPYHLAAVMATTAEHLLPILLILGLFTRYAAIAILIMTLVIQIFVYPSAYPTHASWLVLSLVLIRHGAGTISLDNWLIKRAA
jgi:putative oxidoreductase